MGGKEPPSNVTLPSISPYVSSVHRPPSTLSLPLPLPLWVFRSRRCRVQHSTSLLPHPYISPLPSEAASPAAVVSHSSSTPSASPLPPRSLRPRQRSHPLAPMPSSVLHCPSVVAPILLLFSVIRAQALERSAAFWLRPTYGQFRSTGGLGDWNGWRGRKFRKLDEDVGARASVWPLVSLQYLLQHL